MSNIQSSLAMCSEATSLHILPQQVEEWLRIIEDRDLNAIEPLFTDCRSRVDALKKTLCPDSSTSSSSQVRAAKYDAIDNDWAQMELDLLAIAERVWRCYFVSKDAMKPKEPLTALQGGDPFARRSRNTLTGLIRCSHEIMMLWVEVRLYHVRVQSNFGYYDYDEIIYPATNTITVIQGVFRRLRLRFQEWNNQLQRATGLKLFFITATDIERLKVISKEFGPDRVSVGEVGWVVQADKVEQELIYQYSDDYLLERWRSRKVGFFWQMLLKVTVGYGMKLGRLVIFTCLVVTCFSIGYYLHDAVLNTTCYIQNTKNLSPLGLIVRYLYIGLTNLTSLGSGSIGPCHDASTELLLTVETGAGYFLFATLAALFFANLIGRER